VYFQPQSQRAPRIRLFRSNLLEALTHIHPAVVVVVWAPVIVWFAADAWLALGSTGMTAGLLAAAFGIGLFVWTLVEYLIHRFVFHFSPRTKARWVERLIFLFHGIHHVQPWDKARLVMPPVVSIPLAVLFYSLFSWVLGGLLASPGWLSPVFAGFLTGYLVYDVLHYATHHLPMRGPVLKWLKRNHLLHHHTTPDQRFGVSSPLWDFVLRTSPQTDGREVDERVGLG
jgi:sterol desaturase/sphingolipid hydroxylase (fatty acid hydroxylase superfamily)